jgi:hypothetical protein
MGIGGEKKKVSKIEKTWIWGDKCFFPIVENLTHFST